MAVFVFLAILIAASEGCNLPEQLAGHWDSSLENWNDLTISNTSIHSLVVSGTARPFSCFISEQNTYVLESPELLLGSYKYHFYICLDIVPSDTNRDLVFFRIRTNGDPNHSNQPFKQIPSTDNKTLAAICHKPSTEMPMEYNFFLRKGYEDNQGNETCPEGLQAMFSANFTDDLQVSKCPQGFELNGCNRHNLVFNYTTCGGGADGLGSSGSPNYSCLTSQTKDDVIYTIIILGEEINQQQPNSYHYACLAQNQTEDGLQMMTKSARMCGGTPAVHMLANETMSCRAPPTTTTKAPTTPAGSNTTSQASTPSTQGPGTGDGGQGGGGGNGDGGSAGSTSWGMLSILLPASVSVLAALRM